MIRPCPPAMAAALAIVLAVGCGAPADGTLVAEDAASAALLSGAAAAWGRPELPAAAPDAARATVRWGACPLPGAEALGCWDGATVWLDPSAPPELWPRVVAHEVGHWLRGDGSHLARAAAGGPCYDHGRGPELMCPSAGAAVTDADREFVWAR